MHPTIAEQLAKDLQRDRLAQAARTRLVREARETQGAGVGERRSTVSTLGPTLLLRLRGLFTAPAAREQGGET